MQVDERRRIRNGLGPAARDYVSRLMRHYRLLQQKHRRLSSLYSRLVRIDGDRNRELARLRREVRLATKRAEEYRKHNARLGDEIARAHMILDLHDLKHLMEKDTGDIIAMLDERRSRDGQ